MIGAVAVGLLLLVVLVLVPLRFARAVRRSLRDPEFPGLFVLVVITLAAGTLFYWRVEGGACSILSTSAPSPSPP